MRGLLNFSLSIIFIITLICSSVYGDKQLNFGWHKTEFIDGDCKIETKDFEKEKVTLWTVKFKDGCLAGFMSDLNGSHQRNFRWITKIKHGRLI